MQQVDIIVVGAGMAGASVAYEASAQASVLLLEREAQPGYHSTGRSAAAFIPSYGHNNLALRQLTLASRSFLENPGTSFCEVPLLRQRGLLTIAEAGNSAALQAEYDGLAGIVSGLELLGPEAVRAKLPIMRAAFSQCALYESDVFDIEVDALHQGYLRGLRSRGGELHCAVEIKNIQRHQNRFQVTTNRGSFSAATLVNAAGAWADEVATLAGVAPIGLQPMRRTAVLVDPPLGVSVEDWPLVLDHDGSFYAKPDAGALLISPVDEHPSSPMDAHPEELDIAYAVHHAQQALQLENPHVRHSWAGLRCFVQDRTPVIGFDSDHPGFFWLCGQGGHGIQTAPASARLAAALLFEGSVASALEGYDFSLDLVLPARLRGNSSGDPA